MLGGGAGDRRDQSGVVDQLTVVGEQRAVEAVAAHRRRQFDGPLGGDAARSRQRRRGCARQPAQRIAGEKSGTHQRPRATTHRRQQRHQLRHRPHQMRSVARHQDSAFDRTAAGDSDVAGGQVTQPAVDQFRTPPAGAEGQIVLFHQHDRQPAGGRVQRDTGAGDAAADDEHVDGAAVGQCGQVGGAAGGVQGTGGGETTHQVRYRSART